jgi:DNA/RNA endonuclease G (NUC1)
MDVKTNNSIAFLFPAKDQNTGDHLKCYLVSIDDLEATTGLDFFKDIDDQHEAEIEYYKEEALWPTGAGTTTKNSQTQC